MALLWSGGMDGRVVEVRSAGATRRLLVDGVLHTAWNARAGLTGAVWDPLGLAALAARRRRSALLLGVGGGAAIHLLRLHAGVDRVVAVEREPVLLGVAREHFDVAAPGVDLVEADAVAWVAGRVAARRAARMSGGARPARFDVVIDDLFHEADGEPIRSATGTRWWRRVASLVAPGGVLIANFDELATLRRSGLLDDARVASRFPSALLFSCPGFTNAIVALTRDAVTAAEFRARLAAVPSLAGSAARRLLRFSARDLPRA
ncbi:MAG: hypothetical protein K8T90_04730 [Planctomycetes bacterium]|nr:hypothetical protein [Planctomycetota bacterium]